MKTYVAYCVILECPIFFIGIISAISTISAFFMKKIKIPEIVVYLTVGFILTNTIFGHIDLVREIHTWFIFVENLALGLIGFKIGTSLKLREMLQKSKIIMILLIAEMMGAFLLVFLLILAFTSNVLMAIILAGLATATAPAVTLDIIIRLRAKGELTTMTQWLLAMDDLAAVIIIESVLVYVSSTTSQAHIMTFLINILQEIGLAVLIGIIIGVFLDRLVEKMDEPIKIMEITLSLLLAGMGLAFYFGTSIIITSMFIGMGVTNIGGNNYEKASELLNVVMSPILILFFTLIGARITIYDLEVFPFLVIVYLVARSIGKLVGFYVGGSVTKSSNKLKKYIGLSFFSQGGVTLGLVSIITEKLEVSGYLSLGLEIRVTIILSTVFSVILGTIFTNYAFNNSGEIDQY